MALALLLAGCGGNSDTSSTQFFAKTGLSGTYKKVLAGRCGSPNNYAPDAGAVDSYSFMGNEMIYDSYGECTYRYTYRILEIAPQNVIKVAATNVTLLNENACSPAQVEDFNKFYDDQARALLAQEKSHEKIKFEFRDGRVTISDPVKYMAGQEPAKEPNLDISDCYGR